MFWDVLNPEQYVSLCQIVKRFSYLLIRYPCYSPEFIKRHVERISASQADLREFRQVSSKYRKTFCSLILATLFAYIVKCAFVPFTALSLYDHTDPELSLSVEPDGAHNGSRIIRFACLATNCNSLRSPATTSSLARAELARDLAILPHLYLCRPNLSAYYPPAILSGNAGLLAFSATSFGILVLSVIEPIQKLITPVGNELIMYVVAPVVSRNMMLIRARKFTLDLSASYHHFRDTHLKSLAIPPADGHPELVNGFLRLTYFRHFVDDDQVESFIDDCLPTIRWTWWRKLMARKIVENVALVIVSTAQLSLLILLYVNTNATTNLERMEEFNQNMLKSNCSIWIEPPEENQSWSTGASLVRDKLVSRSRPFFVPAERPQPLDLADFESRWTYFATLEAILCFMSASFGTTISLSLYYSNHCEIICCLKQLHCHLEFAVAVSRKVNLEGRIHQVASKQSEECSLSRRIKTELVRQSGFKFFVLQVQPIARTWGKTSGSRRLDEVIAHEQLAIVVLRGRDAQAARIHLEMMEKLYIEFRLFTDLVHRFSPSAAIVIIYGFALTCGLAVIGIWYAKRVEGFILQPILLISAGWLLASFCMLFATDLHAKACKLEPSIWSLIALTSLSREPKLAHLRLLWVKQIRMLDFQGGLAVRAFSISITYINIIQLMLWTLTIIFVGLGT